jgi:hypothetical protein
MDVFTHNNNDIDAMARNVNNVRKKMANGVMGAMTDYDNMASEICNCMDPKFLPQSFNPNFGFFSTQGDFSDGNYTMGDNIAPYSNDYGYSGNAFPFSETHKRKKNVRFVDSDISNISNMSTNSNNNIFTDINSNDSNDSNNSKGSMFSSNMSNISNILKTSDDMLSSFSDGSSLSPKVKRHLKLNTKHLQNQNDDGKIIDHLKTCNSCQSQLKTLLYPAQSAQLAQPNTTTTEKSIINTNISSMFTSETKDIIILILIGVFVIIMMDIFLKK